MAQINELKKEDLSKVAMICFDVDGVLVPRGTKIAQEGDNLFLHTKRIAPELVDKIKQLSQHGYHINISSGRGLYMLQEMFREILPFVSLTFENGSCTWYRGATYQHVNAFRHLTDCMIRLKQVKHKLIKGWEPKEYIITIHCEDRVEEIEQIVAIYEDLYCLWNGEAYDIGVKDKQTKGTGLNMLRSTLMLPKDSILAIGDNLNDKELLDAASVAISADETRLKGDFYIPLNGEKLPGEVLIDKILELQ